MASNMSDPSAQVNDKSLGSNSVINMTTSETLRLQDSDRTNLHLQAGGVGGGQAFQKKKNSSFQITSITSRLSNDGGEDSADDTEDISDTMDTSKVTDLDQETPSFSEDYSKSEEVFLGPAPVIPTSSQYGITALVQQSGSGGLMTAMLPQGVTVNVTEGGIALAKADVESDDVNHWQNRFKIVKIDSNEPFKRGRWICLDFMDSPAVSAASSVRKDDASAVVVNSSNLKDGEIENPPQTVLQMQVPSQPQQQQPGQGHTMTMQLQYQMQNPSQASTPMMSVSQANQGGVVLPQATHMSVPPPNQAPLSYQAQTSAHPGAMPTPISQGFPTSQAPSSQQQIHPSPPAQTPPQAQPSLQPPLQQPQVTPGVPASVPQGVSATPGMVPTSSLAQHQPGPPQSNLTTQNLQQQQQTQQQGIPISQGSMGGQPMPPGVIGTMGAPTMANPVVGHPTTSQSTGVMGQPQPGLVQQKPLTQQSVVQPSSAPLPIPQSLPSKPLPGTQPPQTGTGQLPVTQQMVTGHVATPAAAPVKTSGVAPVTHPSNVTAPGQPPSHHVMAAAPGTTVQATSAPDSQPPQSQSQLPPTNLEGIPLAQPLDDASNATPPAAAGQDDSER
ncbi:hypothetical protein Pmani_027559 [Petrolisthes manimaculis]|uniref:Uncharacterized protein n=1 Tax=Petrolisthes manimaculis TaxID=1843537 RepID=A0AAE1P412_9EUCA|nr:hypothetical protein Pmani_027559 [Petrolisthes manimaculis]